MPKPMERAVISIASGAARQTHYTSTPHGYNYNNVTLHMKVSVVDHLSTDSDPQCGQMVTSQRVPIGR